MNLPSPEFCPICGEDVPRGSLACPQCGADHLSGWREDADTTGGLDLPDEEFDYDDFVDREFGSRGDKPEGLAWLWWAAALAALLGMTAILLRGA